jgi:hypothetical protein
MTRPEEEDGTATLAIAVKVLRLAPHVMRTGATWPVVASVFADGGWLP